MTADDQSPDEKRPTFASMSQDINAGSVGREDWNPLGKLTGTRPLVSKYGVARYSPLEWRQGIEKTVAGMPSTTALDRETKNIIAQIASACDKEQSENTLKLRQRAVDIGAKNILVCQYCKELRTEVEQMAQYKLRVRKALEYLEIVEGINLECRQIRKNRFNEDLVRDVVEEQLFQEMGLCQEIRQLYMATLNEFDVQYKTMKGCYQEVHSIWSDQRETLDLEAENIGLKSSSDQISFVMGNARLEENMSSMEIRESYINKILESIKAVIESSKGLRSRINNPILSESARDLKQQDEKVLKAFLNRIEEQTSARQIMEAQLEQVLKEITQAESLYAALNTLGRQVDFSLKVVQTRLENRRHRPGAENCRDKPQTGLMQEMKVLSERMTLLKVQMNKINDAIGKLYTTRKKLERQIHVKRHSLSLDQERCMRYRSKFPSIACLQGL